MTDDINVLRICYRYFIMETGKYPTGAMQAYPTRPWIYPEGSK
jgi:hypothetical protein